MVGPKSYPKQKDGILKQSASGTLILLNPDGGKYFALDEVGSRVWDLCDGSRSVSEVASTIHEEYDAPKEAIEADVLELVGDLIHERLLVEG